MNTHLICKIPDELDFVEIRIRFSLIEYFYMRKDVD